MRSFTLLSAAALGLSLTLAGCGDSKTPAPSANTGGGAAQTPADGTTQYVVHLTGMT